MGARWVCIHGHFYQPSRENPWLDAVEVQDTAAPYHDWNERVTAECYARNTAARVLDAEQRIVRIVNNFAHISFNVGPTLARWLARYAPDVHAQLVEADRSSRAQLFGHGNAIAQVYNHLIMPLSDPRDRQTQVIWGIKDFTRRFHRQPEGMWLPETAVDVATLEVLAAQRIVFTILAPHQAWRIRQASDSPWYYVNDGQLDTTVPYRVRLPSGRSIAVFFYDPDISRGIAFEGLLRDGTALAQRLSARLPADAPGSHILTVATDGESYGHHHQFGEMALAYALQQVAGDGDVRVTNPGAYLAAHPPTQEVDIHERTSWSCVHGVERWRADCGCRAGTSQHQRWRGPLREAMIWLKQELDRLYEAQAAGVLSDPWAARDDAIDLIDPDPGAVDGFLGRHAAAATGEQRRHIRRLLEMQRQAMLMQASDGWFFDDIAGPETVQILVHAARAIDLARPFAGTLEGQFIERLRQAPGNVEALPDGAAVYEQRVRPQAVSTARLVAMHAVTALVEDPPVLRVRAAGIERLSHDRAVSGQRTLAVGRVRVATAATGEEEDVVYAVLHFGGHEVHCAAQTGWPEERFAQFRGRLLDRFGRDVLSEVMRLVDGEFGAAYFTLRDLPLDERRRVLAVLTAQTLQQLESTYRRVYQENRPLMEYLRDAQAPIPPALLLAAVFILTQDLESALLAPADRPLSPRTEALVAELRSWGREVRAERFEPLLRARLEAVLAGTLPLEQRLQQAAAVLDLADAAGLVLNLWEAQNRFYRLARAPRALEARDTVRRLGERLSFNVDRLAEGAP